MPSTMLCDNLSAMVLSHNLVIHTRIKHIKLEVYFVGEKVLLNKLKIWHVSALAQSCFFETTLILRGVLISTTFYSSSFIEYKL